MTSPPTTPVTVGRAAELLGISVSTVRRLIRRGILPAWRVGSNIRLRLDDVDSLAVPLELETKSPRRQRRKGRALSAAEKLADRVWGKG